MSTVTTLALVGQDTIAAATPAGGVVALGWLLVALR